MLKGFETMPEVGIPIEPGAPIGPPIGIGPPIVGGLIFPAKLICAIGLTFGMFIPICPMAGGMPIGGGLKFAFGGSPPMETGAIPGGIIPGAKGIGLPGGAPVLGIPGYGLPLFCVMDVF